MDTAFKQDFVATRDQWARFWRDELDHPLVAIVVPKEGVEPVDPPPYMAGADGNYDAPINQALHWAETHEFLGAAIPSCRVTFGPDHFAALLGAELEFNADSDGTSWCVPFVEDWDDVEIRFQLDGKWWQRTAEFIRAMRHRTGDSILPCGTTLSANLDALAAIRGPERLLLDMAVAPDKVHRALDQVTQAYEDAMDALAEELGVAELGQINRHGMYAPDGRINVPQCDFSSMISPAMFREFAVPQLTREVSSLAAAEYHLDGPDAIRHLEAICGIDGIHIIQWVPGAGEAAEQDWTDLYARIDRLGKGQIRGGDMETLRRLWGEYASRKLFWRMSAESKGHAEDLLAQVETLRK